MRRSHGLLFAASCLPGAAILMRRGSLAWQVAAGTLAGAAAAGLLMGDPAWWQHPGLGTFAAGVLFLAAAPESAVEGQGARWVHGISVGALIVVIRLAHPDQPDGVVFAALLGATLRAAGGPRAEPGGRIMASANPLSWWRSFLALPNDSPGKTLGVALLVALVCSWVVSITAVVTEAAATCQPARGPCGAHHGAGGNPGRGPSGYALRRPRHRRLCRSRPGHAHRFARRARPCGSGQPRGRRDRLRAPRIAASCNS